MRNKRFLTSKKAKERLEQPQIEVETITAEEWNRRRAQEYANAMGEEYDEEVDYANAYDPNDEYCYCRSIHDEADYEELYSITEFMDELPRLRQDILTTTFGVLVNYKGEPEGECVVDQDTNTRKFYGKYDYS